MRDSLEDVRSQNCKGWREKKSEGEEGSQNPESRSRKRREIVGAKNLSPGFLLFDF